MALPYRYWYKRNDIKQRGAIWLSLSLSFSLPSLEVEQRRKRWYAENKLLFVFISCSGYAGFREREVQKLSGTIQVNEKGDRERMKGKTTESGQSDVM